MPVHGARAGNWPYAIPDRPLPVCSCKMNHIRQYGKRNCGQIAVAVVTGKTVAEIEAIVGHCHGTKTKELVSVLRFLNYACADKCRRKPDDVPVPTLALAQLRRPGRAGWHWIVVADNMVYDGHYYEAEPLAAYIAVRTALGERITSWLPIVKPASTVLQWHISGRIDASSSA